MNLSDVSTRVRCPISAQSSLLRIHRKTPRHSEGGRNLSSLLRGPPSKVRRPCRNESLFLVAFLNERQCRPNRNTKPRRPTLASAPIASTRASSPPTVVPNSCSANSRSSTPISPSIRASQSCNAPATRKSSDPECGSPTTACGTMNNHFAILHRPAPPEARQHCCAPCPHKERFLTPRTPFGMTGVRGGPLKTQ